MTPTLARGRLVACLAALAAASLCLVDWPWLLDTAPFQTREHCVHWSQALTAAYVTANAAIAIAYFSIPAMLAFLWRHRRNRIASPPILAGFLGFITLSGMTHLLDVVVFWWAPYRLILAVDVLTSALAVLTVTVLPGVILDLLKLPSRTVVHDLNNQLGAELLTKKVREADLEARNRALRMKIVHLEEMLETNAWMSDKQAAVAQLRELLLSVGGPVAGESPGPEGGPRDGN